MGREYHSWETGDRLVLETAFKTKASSEPHDRCYSR